MGNDFLRELEYLGVTARIKRLSDVLSGNIREFYRARDVDIEPSWHLVLLFLKDCSAPPTEIAASLQLSQPAMTRLTSSMVAKGYLEVFRDEADGRKKKIELSAMARDQLPSLERMWAAGEAAIREILENERAFLGHLEAIEDQVRRRSFNERALAHLRDD